MSFLTGWKGNEKAILQFPETHCKNCGALSTQHDVCSYCGSRISADNTETSGTRHTLRTANAERKAIDRALSKIQSRVGKGESVELSFSNDFDFNRRARIRLLYPAMTGTILVAILPFFPLLGLVSITSIYDSNIFVLLSALVTALVGLVPLIPNLLIGLPLVDYVYVMTNLRFEVFSKRGRHMSTIWFSQVRTVVEVLSEFKKLGSVELYSFMKKPVKETLLVPKSKSFRAYVRRIKKLEGDAGTLQFSRRSMVFVDPEKAPEIRSIMKTSLKPNSQMYKFEVNASHRDVSPGGFQ